MHSATTGKNRKTAALRWFGATTGLVMGFAGMGAITAGQVFAGVSPITVTVASDATPSDHFEGVSYSSWGDTTAPIATFTDSDCTTTCQPAGDYTATVLWGDSSANTACPSVDCTITEEGTTNTYDVVATHTYKDEFNCMPVPPATSCTNYPVHVKVTDVPDAIGPVTGDNIAAGGILVKDQPLALSASQYTFAATSGVTYNNRPIGSFQDGNPFAAALDQDGVTGEYTFSINWGDGTAPDTTSGTFSIGTCTVSGCDVAINGTHKYVNSNTYQVDITVNDGKNLRQLLFSSTANVSNDGGTRCTSANVVPSSQSAPAGTTVALNAGAGGCSNPHFQFYIQYPGGVWHLARPWGGSSFNWITANLAPGVYQVHAWANQIGNSMTTFEAYGPATVTLTGCASASLSPAVKDLPPGTSVAFTAGSTGCNAQYKFWIGYPNGTWQMLRDWGGPTFTFNVNPAAKGHFKIHVWANTVGASQVKFEALAESIVNLVVCGSAALSPSPVNQTAGTTVHFVATSTGCVTPQYEYWIGYSNGTWQLLRTWGAGAFDFITNPAAPGTYTIHVWANNTGDSKTTYEAYASSTVTLTP